MARIRKALDNKIKNVLKDKTVDQCLVLVKEKDGGTKLYKVSRTPECKDERFKPVRAGEDFYMMLFELEPETSLKLLAGIGKCFEKDAGRIKRMLEKIGKENSKETDGLKHIPVIKPDFDQVN